MADDKKDFMGDVLLICTPDGGDIVVEDGLVKDCRNFDTAVYLSLFGGNKDDLNGRAKETWWGNLVPGTQRNEWMQSEFGATVSGLPLTSVNLRKASDAASRDLAWLKSDADADSVSSSLSAKGSNRVKLEVEVMQDKQKAGGGSYEFQWQEAVR